MSLSLLRRGRFDTLARRHSQTGTPIMRVILVAGLLALMYPAVVVAQTAAAPSTAPAPPTATTTTAAPRAMTRGGDITKDQYIERAVERARRAAEKRFDKLDADHDGVLSADERGAARAARAKRHAAPAQ
jgi:hypothetical protein